MEDYYWACVMVHLVTGGLLGIGQWRHYDD